MSIAMNENNINGIYKNQFVGKNVLIVGGSKGIGKGLVQSFVSLGATTFYASRTPIENSFLANYIKTDIRNLERRSDLVDASRYILKTFDGQKQKVSSNSNSQE